MSAKRWKRPAVAKGDLEALVKEVEAIRKGDAETDEFKALKKKAKKS